ncbi:hypothetical protein D9619_002170 [Psilocybe cf. subviscida]|uniref:Uncharacterized protein n=1 Tax=Psilocybe cf. subviscida TaxID=2480587 RepID=A0A8H5F292_9AGAR|nr:hypothetical protein D9619_002170 [Psilocybe cf. subviscida]
MSATSQRKPYAGTARKLVLAFDVGTTFSGISYCILDPGVIPEIRGVNRFPAQEDVGGDCKIPTIIYYDGQGAVRAVGAEALDPALEQEDDFDDWTKAEWFKLHLRPQRKSGAHVAEDIPALPRGKSAVQVFADFLRYLYQCARIYIEESHASGVELWKGLQPHTEFVLTHPNGWEGGQQGLMRKAAVMAGLVDDSDSGHQKLSFVTEGEASLHFCIQSGLTSEAIKNGKGIVIVDAGGGTVDISSYKQTSALTQSYQEIAAPQCHFKGSIFVTSSARKFLENALRGSRFFGDVPHITECFDKSTKLRFRNAVDNQYIKFGTLKDKDPKLNIRSGQLRLLGSDVASFFEPSVSAIVGAIEEQIQASSTEISSIFLVGGFAASEWLFAQLKASFISKGLDISRPDSHVNKAVADGAISFHIDHFVEARVSKLAYGLPIHVPYNAKLHRNTRQHTYKPFCDLSGALVVGDHFSAVLPRDTTVTETQEFRNTYSVLFDQRPTTFSLTVMCYRGALRMERNVEYPTGQEKALFSTLCYVEADVSRAFIQSGNAVGSRKPYHQVEVDVILSLGLTELKASVSWTENGVEKRGPAKLVFDPEVVIDDA